MRVLIHCNSGPRLGIGHVMRSLALAAEASASGHEVALVGEIEDEFARSRVDQAGIAVIESGAQWSDGEFQDVLAASAPDLVHIDSYDTAADILQAVVRERGLPLSNMQDGQFGMRSSDLLIDPTLGAEWHPQALEPGKVSLRGARFAPMRREVAVRRGRWRLRVEAERVLVSMGGTDPAGLTALVVDALAATSARHVTVVGRYVQTPGRGQGRSNLTVEQLDLTDELPSLAATHDLVVTAAGTSTLEFCCVGTPMVIVCATENQRSGYEALIAAGAAVGLTHLSDQRASTQVLEELMTEPDSRRALSKHAVGLVDDLGAWRVVRAWEQLLDTDRSPVRITEKLLTVRAACLEDAEDLLSWRNDADTRRYSRQGAKVPPQSHATWLRETLGRSDRHLLIACDDLGAVGTVRWDQRASRQWEVSLTVAPSRRGQSLSRHLLGAGERWLRQRESGALELMAEVHVSNSASRRLFAVSGYHLDRPQDEQGVLAYRKVAFG